MRVFMLVFAAALPVFAGEWEIGGAGGWGFYHNGSINAPAGTATAGVRNRFTIGAVLSEEMFDWLGGEIRYTMQDGDPFLARGGVKANVQGQSHAIHYDLLFHFRPLRARVRPFIAAGLGAKWYVVTGPESASQALGNIGLLTSTEEVKPLATPGFGVKVRMSERVLLRFDFRDYITPFPKRIITPAPGGTARGFWQQLTPMVGIGVAL